jgi:hypothetical protein
VRRCAVGNIHPSSFNNDSVEGFGIKGAGIRGVSLPTLEALLCHTAYYGGFTASARALENICTVESFGTEYFGEKAFEPESRCGAGKK